MAAPSRPPNFRAYSVKPVCAGCGRKLVAKNEMALWFVGHPVAAVYGPECFHLAPEASSKTTWLVKYDEEAA